MDSYLAMANSDKGRLLSATIWLKDLKDIAAVNSVWDAWLPKGSAPMPHVCAISAGTLGIRSRHFFGGG
jgi:enamine deaminase RidA (YjgF/YER057c/UK114 family)